MNPQEDREMDTAFDNRMYELDLHLKAGELHTDAGEILNDIGFNVPKLERAIVILDGVKAALEGVRDE